MRKYQSRSFLILSQVFIILLLFIIGWQALHRTPQISEQAYNYLNNLDPDLILAAYKESRSLDSDAWADIIAIRSTLNTDALDSILSQRKQGVKLKHIDWGKLERTTIEQIKSRKKYLTQYPYYEPGRFTFPVVGDTWYIDTYGADREGGRRTHEGTDLFSPEGTPIVSVCDGIVEKSGWNRLGGERVGIRGFDGNYYYYAHLKEIHPSIKIGKRIAKGEILGTMGHTGDALTTPDHLHFGIELPNQQWINPYPFLVVWQKQMQLAQ